MGGLEGWLWWVTMVNREVRRADTSPGGSLGEGG